MRSGRKRELFIALAVAIGTLMLVRAAIGVASLLAK
jgi:hypothetical protein